LSKHEEQEAEELFQDIEPAFINNEQEQRDQQNNVSQERSKR
jgi:hypothetical protein